MGVITMAKAARKPTAPTMPDTAPVKLPEPWTVERIVSHLQGERDKALAWSEDRKARFVDGLAKSAVQAFRWMASDVLLSKGIGETWQLFFPYVEHHSGSPGITPSELIARLTAFVDVQLRDIGRSRPWELNTTCPYDNIVNRDLLSGKSHALEIIAAHLEIIRRDLAKEGA
jgi:hypothetical protein